MTKKLIRITDGGIALPLGNNTFLMRGRLHSQGGIGIGNGGKNDIEVEDGEVVKFNKNNIQVLSDQPMLNGISPANALLAGGNFNKIFKAQQSINGNYGGSYAENGTNKDNININEDNVKNWINSWLNGRKNQLKENAKSTSFTYKNYKSLNNKGDIRDNGYDVTYKDNLLNPLYFLLGENPNNIRTENIIKSQLYNIDNVATINVGDYYKPNYGKLGVYVNPNPWNNTGHYIAYKGVPLDGVRVHELTHASHPDQQIDYITDIIYKDRDIPVNKNGRQTNRDKAKEVYSAIQQYRFENGLKPEDVIDKTYIENNKDKIKSTPYLENINEDDLINIFNNVAKNDDKNKNNNVFYAKNGGQINMKLKYKNKQDITDMVMNEILPHSTGERKKFLWGGSEWALVGNAGINLLSGLGQGIAGSINASKLRKMYDSLKRQSTFIPVAREHINTKVDVEPQLNLTAQTEYNLRRNAEMNTSNSKVARSQARAAALDRIRQDNAIYSDKYNKEAQLRNAEAELQTKYNLVDLENKLTDIREQNDFDMQKAIGKANAGTMEAQTWGNAIASTLGNTATSLMDYATMQNDLLKSNNKESWDRYDEFQWGMYTDGVDANGKPILKSKYTDPNHPLYNSKRYKRIRNHFGIS